MEKLTYPVYPKADPDGFGFTTTAGVVYSCYFVSAKEIFSSYPDVATTFYAFNLEVESGDAKQQNQRIGIPVTAIIEVFLNENESAVVYLCDISDGRQALRKRKFNSWFKQSDTSDIEKIDREIRANDTLIFNSLMISKLNPLFNRIVFVFQDFNERMNNK